MDHIPEVTASVKSCLLGWDALSNEEETEVDRKTNGHFSLIFNKDETVKNQS